MYDRGRVYIDPLLISRGHLLLYGLHGSMPDLQHGNLYAPRLWPARCGPRRMRGLDRHHLRRSLRQYVGQLQLSTCGNLMLGSNLHEFHDPPVRQDLSRERWRLRQSHPSFGDVFLRLHQWSLCHLHSQLCRQVQRPGRMRWHLLCHLPNRTNLRSRNGQCVRMRSQLHQQVWWCQRWMQWYVHWPVLREFRMSKWRVSIMWEPDCMQRVVREPSVGSDKLRSVRQRNVL